MRTYQSRIKTKSLHFVRNIAYIHTQSWLVNVQRTNPQKLHFLSAPLSPSQSPSPLLTFPLPLTVSSPLSSIVPFHIIYPYLKTNKTHSDA